MLVAAGPFSTAGTLDYSPLNKLCRMAENDRPDLFMLVGPFLDIQHPMVPSSPHSLIPPPPTLQNWITEFIRLQLAKLKMRRRIMWISRITFRNCCTKSSLDWGKTRSGPSNCSWCLLSATLTLHTAFSRSLRFPSRTRRWVHGCSHSVPAWHVPFSLSRACTLCPILRHLKLKESPSVLPRKTCWLICLICYWKRMLSIYSPPSHAFELSKILKNNIF